MNDIDNKSDRDILVMLYTEVKNLGGRFDRHEQRFAQHLNHHDKEKGRYWTLFVGVMVALITGGASLIGVIISL